MKYEDYKAQYERHTKKIESIDKRLESNKESTARTDGALASEREKQNALQAQADADPAAADIDAIKASDKKAGELRELQSALSTEQNWLTKDRLNEEEARSQLKTDNPECRKQGNAEGLHPDDAPDSGRSGPGMGRKVAAVGVAAIALGHEAYVTVHHAVDPENKEIHQPHTHEEHEHEPKRRGRGGPGEGDGGGSGPHPGDATFATMPSPDDTVGGYYVNTNTSVSTTIPPPSDDIPGPANVAAEVKPSKDIDP